MVSKFHFLEFWLLLSRVAPYYTVRYHELFENTFTLKIYTIEISTVLVAKPEKTLCSFNFNFNLIKCMKRFCSYIDSQILSSAPMLYSLVYRCNIFIFHWVCILGCTNPIFIILPVQYIYITLSLYSGLRQSFIHYYTGAIYSYCTESIFLAAPILYSWICLCNILILHWVYILGNSNPIFIIVTVRYTHTALTLYSALLWIYIHFSRLKRSIKCRIKK